MQQRRVLRVKNPPFNIESIPPTSKVQYFRVIKIAFEKSKSSNHRIQAPHTTKKRSCSVLSLLIAGVARKINSACVSCVRHFKRVCVLFIIIYSVFAPFLRPSNSINSIAYAIQPKLTASLRSRAIFRCPQRITALLRKNPAIR